MYVYRTIETRSRNHCCRGKRNKHCIFCVCVYVVILHAKRMRRFILSSLACHIFALYLINGTISWGGVIEHKMCVLSFSTTFVWNISHSKGNSGRSPCKVAAIFFRFQWNLSFLDRFSKERRKITQISNFVKLHPVWSEVFHADRVEIDMKLSLFAIVWTRLKIRAQTQNSVTVHPPKPKIQLNLLALLHTPTAHCPFDHLTQLAIFNFQRFTSYTGLRCQKDERARSRYPQNSKFQVSSLLWT